jgi:hypothetical protein
LRIFRLTEILLFLISITSLVVVNLSGAESLLTGLKWSILNNINIRIASIILIVLPLLITIWKDRIFRKADASSLVQVVEDLVLPNLTREINTFCAELKQEFSLEDDLRITLFVPCREGIFKWRLKMACQTDNVKDREKKLAFKLNEGAIGSTLAAAKAHVIKFFPVSKRDELPSTYVHLNENNKQLVARNIKGILVLGSFQDGFICGLLAVDTTSSRNLLSLEDEDLHDSALDWVTSKSAAFKFLWRAKNNV